MSMQRTGLSLRPPRPSPSCPCSSRQLPFTGLERLLSLVMHGVDDLGYEAEEFARGQHAIVTWPGDIDLDALLDPPGPCGHYRDTTAEKNRFLDVVRDEKDRDLILVVDLKQALVHNR